MMNNYESLNSTVKRQGFGRNELERVQHGKRCGYVATCGVPGAQSRFVPSRVELQRWSVFITAIASLAQHEMSAWDVMGKEKCKGHTEQFSPVRRLWDKAWALWCMRSFLFFSTSCSWCCSDSTRFSCTSTMFRPLATPSACFPLFI